jgi:restriction endonuclease S subunit
VYVMYSHQKPCLIVSLFQENKSFGASYHLHSSSDVCEVLSRTGWTYNPSSFIPIVTGMNWYSGLNIGYSGRFVWVEMFSGRSVGGRTVHESYTCAGC